MNSVQVLKKVKDLPTISVVASQINTELKKKSLTAKSLARFINQDASLAAKILKMSNSAYYGLTRQVGTVEKAVTVLGLNTIQNLALSVSVFKVFRAGPPYLDFQGLWLHSLGCGVAAKNLAQVAYPRLADQAFLCGVLHDIGKIAIADKFQDELAMVIKLMNADGTPQSEAEKEVIGFTHQKLGGLIADSWNFPESYVKCVKRHHGPFPLPDSEEEEAKVLAESVYVGNKTAKALSLGKSTDPFKVQVTPEDLAVLKVTGKELPKLIQQIKEDYRQLLVQWQMG